MTPLTEKQDELIAEYCSKPIPLLDGDIYRPFVYDREYGFFYVPCGYLDGGNHG